MKLGLSILQTRNLRNLLLALLVAFLAFTTPHSLLAQERPGFSIQLRRVNLEKGILYHPIARATIACPARNWTVTISWGDDTPTEMLSHDFQPGPGGTIPAGTYDVFSDRSYSGKGSYSVDAELSVRCEGDSRSGVVDREKFLVNVFDRIPVKDFVLTTTAVNRGAPIHLTIRLVAPAPASGTRILLTTDKPAGVFPDNFFPMVIEIPEKSDQAQIRIPTTENAATGLVNITAVAVDGKHPLSINIK